MKKKLLFFVNPKSGHGSKGFDLMGILEKFSMADYRVEMHPTRFAGDLKQTLAQEGSGYDMVVASGGDGTLNEASSGLMAIAPDRRPVLGYIPKGTVNDVSYNLGLSKDPLKAAEDIVTGVPFTMDVGRFNENWFNYVAAFGLFTDVSYRTSQNNKRILGRLAYLLDGVKSLKDIRGIRVKLTVDGETREEEVLLGLVTSTLSVGGFHLMDAENVALNDGLFEVLLVRKMGSMKTLKNVIAALRKRDFSGESFFFCKTGHVKFAFDTPVDWTLDGEYGGTVSEAVIDNCHDAVTIQVPANPVENRAASMDEEQLTKTN